MLSYVQPVYRPPSEANSLIFQITLGCSFNKCSFCDMYRNKEYSERKWEDIKEEIDFTAKHLPETRRIFLADGDALNLSTEKLTQILDYLYKSYPSLERISCYAMPKNLWEKSDEELQVLRKAGLVMFYLGIESGSNTILKKVTKGATAQGIINACLKARRNNFILSCMVILGLGGQTYTEEHIRETANVVNAVSPDYLAALSLYLEIGVKEEFLTKFKEPFIPLNDDELLDEVKRLVEQIDSLRQIVFRANHASNAYLVGATLPEEKQKVLDEILSLKVHPELARPKEVRRF
ncbi:MAG: radical SAM protein [Thaumarchaeota archaeon]|nr:radical SAM protein [Nitrososphaerota archaeon]